MAPTPAPALKMLTCLARTLTGHQSAMSGSAAGSVASRTEDATLRMPKSTNPAAANPKRRKSGTSPASAMSRPQPTNMAARTFVRL